MPDEGFHFTGALLQWGPVPPSGGPRREAYLDQHGRESLREFESEYNATLASLSNRTVELPALDFELVGEDDDAARAIQVQMRNEWNRFRAALDRTTLASVEPHVAKATASAVAALNYLEDHELRETAHLAIHRSTFVKRGLFGCQITWRDGGYWTNCQFNISHMRIGMSAGMLREFRCSVCEHHAEDCDHQIGEPYEVQAEHNDGVCSICEAAECEHAIGQSYVTTARLRLSRAELREASLVARPRYPQARIIGMTKDLGAQGKLPNIRAAAEQGILNCDADLGPCKGLRP